MKLDDYSKGLRVKLIKALPVKCCQAGPIPTDAEVVTFDRVSKNRAMVGLYFPPDAPYGATHHTIFSLAKFIPPDLGPPLPADNTVRAIFPSGGFCLHKVKISSIQGSVTGYMNPKVFEK